MKIFEIDKLVASLQGYIETKIELLKLDAKDELSLMVSRLLVFGLLIFFGCMSILFFSFSMAYYLNELLESSLMGFLIIGLFFLLFLVSLYFLKDRILKKVSKSIDLDE